MVSNCREYFIVCFHRTLYSFPDKAQTPTVISPLSGSEPLSEYVNNKAIRFIWPRPQNKLLDLPFPYHIFAIND